MAMLCDAGRLKPHDNYFRAMFSSPAIAQDFFESQIPQSLRTQIDFATFRPYKESFVDETLKTRVVDSLYCVGLYNGKGCVYCLVEHTSTLRSNLMSRVTLYIAATESEHIKKRGPRAGFPLVLASLIYTGTAPSTSPLTHSMCWREGRKMRRISSRDAWFWG